MSEDSTTPLTGPEDELATEVRHLAAVRAVAEIDLARRLPRYAEGKSRFNAFSKVPLALSEAERLLADAPRVKPVREGFSGAEPYEIALRFAAEQITHEQLVDELTRWQYTPDQLPPEPLDDGAIRGDWNTYVTRAFDPA